MWCNWLIGRGAVLLVTDGMIRTEKQLPEVSGLQCGTGLHSAWLGLPAIGGVATGRRGCGPAVGQWDDQDGKAAAGSGNDCGVGQGCPLPGWGFLRLVGWQYRKINYSRLPHPHALRFRVRMFRMHGPQ